MVRIGLIGCGRIGNVHAAAIAAAAKANKPVLCEKPIDLDIARVDSCWAEIASPSPTVMLAFNRRFDASFRKVRDRVARGDIGIVQRLVITSRDLDPSPKEYVAASGGIFRDMTIHDLDTARAILGEIVEVHAIGTTVVEPYFAEVGDVDTALVMLRSADGALARIGNARRCAYGFDQRIEVFGSSGTLTAGNHLPTTVRHFSAQHADAAPPVGRPLPRPLPPVLRNAARPHRHLRRDRHTTLAVVRRRTSRTRPRRRRGPEHAHRKAVRLPAGSAQP